MFQFSLQFPAATVATFTEASGENQLLRGPLARAWKQQVGVPSHLLEIDIKNSQGHDMLLDTGVCAGLICAVLHDKVEAVVVGGPNCRTRSVLRHYPKENAPRPVRGWGGEEFGLSDLSKEQEKQVTED